jgi:hypothetical protein
MAAPQPVEYQQGSSGVFEKKHYMDITTEFRGDLLKAMGEVMLKHAKTMESAK